MILNGSSADEIKAMWQDDVENSKNNVLLIFCTKMMHFNNRLLNL